MTKIILDRPLAITMWDFSWIERRWSGAGYEDWDQVLIELKERGYDAVRIDAYPHLLAVEPDKEWLLKPVWNQQTWGSPANNKVIIKHNLKTFLETCKRHEIKVALSTWFREDVDNTRMNIKSPKDLGHIWKITLDYIKEWDLMDIILYVDLCNEFPLGVWVPFVEEVEGKREIKKESKECKKWMEGSIDYLRSFYKDVPLCFSFTCPYDNLKQIDVSYMDLLEPHIWMTSASDFYKKVDYNFEMFSSEGYDNLVMKGEQLYREDPEYWKNSLKELILEMAKWSENTGKPLVTTECWGIVDYKDWPLLNWEWIKELCEFGVKEAIKTNKWVMIATSNFCGPQFVGMWRDIEWHKKLTNLIHNSKCII